LEERNQKYTTNTSMIMICLGRDDLDLLHSLRQALASDYCIITVDSGTECLIKYIDEKVKGNQIDILVIEYRLRDLEGDIVASTIRELSGSRGRATNTILISSYQLDKELVEELKQKDYIIEVMEKPISIDSLIKTIKRAVA
jgi:DNA-binding NtrC family response regulator